MAIGKRRSKAVAAKQARKAQRAAEGSGKSRYARKVAARRRGNFTKAHRRAFPNAYVVGG